MTAPSLLEEAPARPVSFRLHRTFIIVSSARVEHRSAFWRLSQVSGTCGLGSLKRVHSNRRRTA